MQPFGNIRQLVTVGADAVMLYFSGDSLEQANSACQQWLHLLDSFASKASNSWIVECVPSYDSLLIVFDIEQVDSHCVYRSLQQWQAQLHNQNNDDYQKAIKRHTLPVWYGAKTANDLDEVSRKTSLRKEDVIALHTSMEFKVYAVGFAPGFAYMGELPKALQCARLASPRKKVPKGAVAIADRQTAVYPSDSPGGWNLLGLCPVPMVGENNIPLLSAGDIVTFSSITESEFVNYHAG